MLQWEEKRYLWEIEAELLKAYSWQKMFIAEHLKKLQLKKEVFKYLIYRYAPRANQTVNMPKKDHYLSQRRHQHTVPTPLRSVHVLFIPLGSKD